MRRSLFLFAMMLVCGGCAGAPPVRAFTAPVQFTTVEKGAGSFYSRFGEAVPLAGPTLLVFTTAEEFASFWKGHHGNLTPLPPVPEVDFGRYAVVVAMDTVEPTGGYSVEIREITEGADVLFVNLRKTKPGQGCITTQSLTQPFHIVKVEQSGKRFVLKLMETVHECR